jgi:hypothetical protein
MREQDFSQVGAAARSDMENRQERIEGGWGRWMFSTEDLCLVLSRDGREVYDIPLGTLASIFDVYDRLAQVHEKTWVEDSDVRNLLRALDDLIGLRATSFQPMTRARATQWRRAG